MSDDEDDYRVEQTPNGVRIKLGPTMPFEVPRRTAIHLAALLAKKAGCEVVFRDGSMKIKFPHGFKFADEDEVAETMN